MGGYGLYVWGSVLVVLAVIAGELVELSIRRRSTLRLLRTELKEPT